MADQSVRLVITSDASGAITGLNMAGNAMKKLSTDSGGITSSIKQHWLGMSASIYAAYQLIQKAWNLAEIAAGYQESRTQLQGLAAQYNTTADQIIAGVKKASDGMISNSAAAQAAVSALSKGLSADQLIQIADASKTLSDVMGMDAEPAFQRIAEALEIGKEKTLKLAVGTLDLKDRYGSLVETWSEAEKTAQMFNLVMEKSKQIQAEMGDSTDGTKDAMETFKADIKDLSDTIGKYLIKAFLFTKAAIQGFKADMYAAAAGVSDFMSIASKITDSLGLTNASAGWAETRDDLGAKSKELMQAGQKTFETAYEWGGKLDDKVKSVKGSMDSAAISAGKMDVQMKELLKVKQERLKEWEAWFEKLKSEHAKAIDTMIKKQEELFDIKKKTSDLLFNLDQTQRNPVQQYQQTADRLRERESGASGLPADQQIKELQNIQQEWSTLTQQVEANGSVYLTQQQAFARAREEVSRLGRDIEGIGQSAVDASQAEIDSVEATKSKVLETMNAYKEQIAYIETHIPTLKIDTSAAEAKLRDLSVTVDSLFKKLGGDMMSGDKEIVFDMYGTGSDKKPIMEKLKEIQGGYDALPRSGKFTMNMEGGDGQPIMSSLSEIGSFLTGYRNEQYLSALRSASAGSVSGLAQYNYNIANEKIAGAWAGYDNKMNSVYDKVFKSLFSGNIGSSGSGSGGSGGGGQPVDDSDTFNISINFNGGINGINDPEQLAKDIVKPLQLELQRLAAIS